MNVRLALASVAMAFAVVFWGYGVYCYVQMVRHRRSGVSRYTVFWPARDLTEPGRAFKRRALVSYGAVIALLIAVFVLARLPVV